MVYDRLDSTNRRALELANEEANHGLVVSAREQTTGRGQHGRSWVSPPDSSVLMSALVFPPRTLQRPVLLTAWVAVAVCDVIRRTTGLRASIKWPNDVLLGGKKVCGILIEQRRGTVVGIGLNVRQSPRTFRSAGLTEATSLAIASGQRTLSPALLSQELCARLEALFQQLLAGKRERLEQRWRTLLGLRGQEVVAECHDATHRGRVKELGFDGVRLKLPGETITLVPETVLHLTAVSEV